MSHACQCFWDCYKTLAFCSLLGRCRIPCACHAKPHPNLKKRSETTIFLHFWLRKQRRARFAHLSFQKCSEAGVWCTFWLGNVFCAATACTFSTSELPKVLEHEVFLAFWLPNVLRATTARNFSSLISPDGSAPVALASLLFDPLEPQIIGKTECSRLFYLFAHLRRLSSDSFSSLIFSFLCFSSLTLPTSAFPSVHIVGSLTSKLPAIIPIVFCIVFYIPHSDWLSTPKARSFERSSYNLWPRRRSVAAQVEREPWLGLAWYLTNCENHQTINENLEGLNTCNFWRSDHFC